MSNPTQVETSDRFIEQQTAPTLRDVDISAVGSTGQADPSKAATSDGHFRGRLLTIRELAGYLGVAEQTIRNHAADIPGRKKFGAGKRGGRVLYDRETIDRWIEKNNGVTDLWVDGRRMVG